ncbi:phytoene desaturase family protein [Microbacterium sp.]|uniref:phytoene desaturase family protein n=1 Tax=Microbacterium sp. TaxID=51671 RepID=UPI003C77058F
MSETVPTHDIVIVGGGHNGLTAAAYLARAGLSVLLLERLDATGGAAVSARAFAGLDARLSRYAYLVSLLPQRIKDDLGLDIRLARRRYSSYTPLPGDAEGRGLLVNREDAEATRASFAEIDAAADAEGFAALYEKTTRVAAALWPTVTNPLPTRSEARAALGDDELWEAIFERPIGEFIEAHVDDDLVRGVVLTDALIGTFAAAHQPDLQQNKCFFYHVIGGGTGDWDVPIGGMGEVTGQLAAVAGAAGAELRTDAEVVGIRPDGTVTYRTDAGERTAVGIRVLANVAPAVLDELLGTPAAERASFPQGAQVKVNLLLKRLPRLRDGSIAPEAAFGGTFHINEEYSQLQTAYERAATGAIPTALPCEIYCHSLADRTILGPELAASGAQTLTVFGLHVPDGIVVTAENNDAQRERLQAAVLASLNSVLAEPVEDLLMTDSDGLPCIETKTTQDLEHALNLPGGNIFHGPLSWPFLEDDAPRDTPAQRWGVATAHDRILLCGSGAGRGGAVSGLGGHNAAMAVLEELVAAGA